MLASKLLVALFALPLAALAQDVAAPDSAAPAEGTDGAAPADTEVPAETGSATTESAASASKTKSIGADINNTGNGQGTGETGNWTLVNFTTPNADYYWVMGVENYAVFTPYTEPINLVIFNSNGTTFKGNRTIAENIPAGTGTWKGMIADFGVGNNYIVAAAPVSDPTRKVGQTRGFWIKRAGTFQMTPPTEATVVNSTTAGSSTSAAPASSTSNSTTSGGTTNGTTNSPAGGNATGGNSSAGVIAVSAGGLFAAAAVALAF